MNQLHGSPVHQLRMSLFVFICVHSWPFAVRGRREDAEAPNKGQIPAAGKIPHPTGREL